MASSELATLRRLYAALEQDHVELARRYAMTKARIAVAQAEKALLVDELCRYPASDFDSDSDDGDDNDEPHAPLTTPKPEPHAASSTAHAVPGKPTQEVAQHVASEVKPEPLPEANT
ncbi:hypothetical protein SPRG_02864 [Saprolegnia parasitica CBS 223.65]|uniref:Uncharacterized protein n=1 Tax=Saprolegnia parasitica (strain CBS 223.65) TaxID=695850 RepID=A0A067D009_SAPPC|nr:hypothetical protein SPRG_02864 [Saprolegnia parasitica CBS 223.65]KDO32387.1 hypothetical protein SPRG_02864 [Saprolegnia parasitica CBS 223.65]|eukprot:XP_012196841.1 hypothetical protein SPRG_02864 [Saprolegnia parasitica CBS 223.65]